ncbi:MAG: hypothetical protein L3J91_01555, partial [Thermoplasmata archaeon]|nr:hypothetical protein [Thermoplasmata archaeon]
MAVQAPRYSDWLDAGQVAELGREDPAALRSIRDEAFRSFLELPLEPDPLYRKYGYFSGVDLTGLAVNAAGHRVARIADAPSTVTVIHDAAGSHAEVPEDLRSAGVRLETYPGAVRSGEVPVETFLRGTDKPPDRLTALGVAVLNRGYRLELPDRLSAAVRLKDVTVLSQEHQVLSVRRSVRMGRQTRLLASEEVYCTADATTGQRLYGSSTDLDIGDVRRRRQQVVH